MKTLILFILSCFIGTGAFLGSLSASNPYPSFAVGFGIWILFFIYLFRNQKKAAIKKHQEQLFNQWYRNHGRFMK